MGDVIAVTFAPHGTTELHRARVRAQAELMRKALSGDLKAQAHMAELRLRGLLLVDAE